MELLRRSDVRTPGRKCTLLLYREDLTAVYPGMIRFTLRLLAGDEEIGVFRTNTYEYSPTVPLDAETVANDRFADWEQMLRESPDSFIDALRAQKPRCIPSLTATDVVIIQGSPRPGGNCSILAGYAARAAQASGKTVQVIFPGDMEIAPCIGCYQCYNTGWCTYEDDMDGIIHAIRNCALLVVCTPVYTNTIPAGLKAVIDRCQALHAVYTLEGVKSEQNGLLLSVAGRIGKENFACVESVVAAFMANLEIRQCGSIFYDGMDALHDVRRNAGAEDAVRKAVQAALVP